MPPIGVDRELSSGARGDRAQGLEQGNEQPFRRRPRAVRCAGRGRAAGLPARLRIRRRGLFEELLGIAAAKARPGFASRSRRSSGANKEPTLAAGESNPASAASLGALVVDAAATLGRSSRAVVETHITLASSDVAELRPPGKLGNRSRFRLLLSAIAVLAVVGSVAVRSSLRSENHHPAQVPAPAATRTHAHEPPRAKIPIAPTATAPEAAPSAATAAPADEISKTKASPVDPAKRTRRPLARGETVSSADLHPHRVPPPLAPPAPTSATRDPLEKRY